MRNHQNASFTTKMKKLLVVVLSLAMVFTSLNLGTASAAKKKPALSKSSVTLFTGHKTTLKVANKIKGASYTWSSSDKKVATVSTKGVVKAKSKGTATVTCKVKSGKKTTYTLSCKVTVLKAATVVRINNKAKAKVMKVGQKYNLNRTLYPNSSNDKTYWTSSDTSIAKPDKNGKFKALSAGVVTITATTKSGATDSVTIKVYGGEVTVGSQEELDAALASYVADITIATGEAVAFKIPAGKYPYKTLTVDAPKADVTNEGTFDAITINQIKADTWYEDAVNNVLTINALTSRVVVGKNAEATINVEKDGANVAIVNDGRIEALNVDAKADIDISGSSKIPVPVFCNKEGAKITSCVPLDVTCTAKVTLVLNAGAEGTVIRVASEDLIPTIYGTISVTVIVGEGDAAEERTVQASPAPVFVGPAGSGSGGHDVPVTSEIVSLSGVVTAVTGSALSVTGTATSVSVSGASVRVSAYDGTDAGYASAVDGTGSNNLVAVTDENGKYSFSSLTAGKYAVVVSAPGYKVEVASVTISANAATVKDFELTALAEGEEGIGTVSGELIEAITNTAVVVTGGSFTLVATMNDGSQSFTVEVVSGSAFSFENLPAGHYTVKVTDNRTDVATHFAPTQFDMNVLGGVTIANKNCYLSNSDKEGTATIVLKWGMTPRDLDSHLVGKDAAGHEQHIWYSEKTAEITVSNVETVTGSAYDEFASRYDLRLDLDDTDGEGPETTSIYHGCITDPVYKFYVRQYSNDDDGSTLYRSDANVTITTLAGAKTFYVKDVPNGTTERVWYVCDINVVTGEVTGVNQLISDMLELEN